MKTLFRLSGTLFLLALVLPIRASLDPATIPTDVRWVVHADLNAIRNSTLGKQIITQIEMMQRDATQGMIGIDIEKVLNTIGSVTAYGANFSKEPHLLDGTLVARGTADLRKIAEALILQATITQPQAFSEVKDLGFPAYAINGGQAQKAGAKMELIVAFPPEGFVIVGRSRAHLQRAYDFARGRGPAGARGGNTSVRNLLKNSENAYLFIASDIPPDDFFTDDGPHARILKMAKSGSFVLGELGTETFAQLELQAVDDDTAEKLLKILQGMTALLSMAEATDRGVGEFLNATIASRSGNAVAVSMSYASERLTKMIEAIKSVHTIAEPVRAPNRQPPAPTMTIGTVAGEWTADDPAIQATPDGFVARTIENVSLKSGSLITLGRNLNKGEGARFVRVEISQPGMPALTFRADSGMRTTGMRNPGFSMQQFEFPGADGVYNVKAVFVNDPRKLAKFAVSVREPRPPAAAPTVAPAPKD